MLHKITILFGLFLSVLIQTAYGNQITGIATITDGDTIKINGTRIRLQGIDAPEISQTCRKNNIEYRCGLESKIYLQKLIENKKVTCQIISKDRYGRSLAKCYNFDNIDINAMMVSSGNAIAYLYYSKDYRQQQINAKKKRIGIWSGSFIEPYKYRKMKKRNIKK